MSVLLIADENETVAIPAFEEHVTVACRGLEGRIGDKFQHLRERGDVIFTGGMEPRYYFAKRGIHFDLIIDGGKEIVRLNTYKGIDHIPD